MKGETILELLGGFGVLLFVLPFLNISFFSDKKVVFLSAGILLFVIYRKMYTDESTIKLEALEKRLNRIESNLMSVINKQDNKISEIKGWMEAINFFKNKKGAIDPLILILITLLIIIIILALQGKL